MKNIHAHFVALFRAMIFDRMDENGTAYYSLGTDDYKNHALLSPFYAVRVMRIGTGYSVELF